MPSKDRSREWCFTINNYTESDIAQIKALRHGSGVVSYIEECPKTGTPHLQCYVHMRDQIGLPGMKKLLPRAHLEPRLPHSTPQHAWKYCMKGTQKTEEWRKEAWNGPSWGLEAKPCYTEGTWPQPGKRSDLAEVFAQVTGGKRSADQIAEEDPALFHQYGRTLTKLEDIALRRRYRTEMTTCDWLSGPTSVGKSHRAFEGFHPDTHYVWKLNEPKGWQDGYTGQQTVIMNDFRGEIRYNELLQLIDKWPHTVPRRGREPAPFLAKHIIITSSQTPEQVYNVRAVEDSLKQLLRRIKHVEMGDSGVAVLPS